MELLPFDRDLVAKGVMLAYERDTGRRFIYNQWHPLKKQKTRKDGLILGWIVVSSAEVIPSWFFEEELGCLVRQMNRKGKEKHVLEPNVPQRPNGVTT